MKGTYQMKDYLHLFGGMLAGIVLLAAYIFCWGLVERCYGNEDPHAIAEQPSDEEAVAEIPTATNDQSVVVATLFEDGSTNTWTAADLQAALGLMNRKYRREQETESGRVTWHGKRMGQYILDDGNGGQCLVQLYEDGFAWTNAAKRVSLKDPEAAAKAKAAAEARQAEWERTHLPPDVAALLAARRAAANGVTNVVINAAN